MIVVMRGGVTREQVDEVSDRLEKLGYVVNPIYGVERTVIGAVGTPDLDKFETGESLKAYEFVEDVIFVGSPYKFVSKQSRPDGTVVDVRGVKLGGKEAVVMAGPCTVETEDQLFKTAAAVARAGAKILRGGAYKPSTSPYGFQGLGVPALELLKEAGCRYDLRVVTEVMDVRKVELVSQYADLLQIGTRNMQNYDLLREVGQSGVPVLLKRGMSARIEEWLLAAEYIGAAGNENIVLCERGIRSFELHTRNTLDLAAVPALKTLTHLPVIVDPSQGTGRRELVGPMSKAAIACGADGLIIEVHPNPDHAVKDGAQSVTIESFEGLMPELRAVAQAVGREIG
jgi:3-deoxy-7-phosphoheptulonate synthase